MAVSGAIIVSAAIAYESSERASKKAEEAQNEANRRADLAKAEAEAKDKAMRMNVDTSKGAKVKYGADNLASSGMTSQDLMMTPVNKVPTTLGGTTGTGLGF